MERDYAVGVIEREGHRILELARNGDEERLARAVESCPGWDLGEVVKHLGNVYNWVGVIVGGRLTDRPARNALPERPTDISTCDWMADRLNQLVGVLKEVPDDVAVWTFSGTERAPAFWWRRQAHETLIHRVDAEGAVGLPITPIEPVLAADNVSELFEIRSFTKEPPNTPAADATAQAVSNRAPDPAPPGPAAAPGAPDGAGGGRWPRSVHLHATDIEGAEWTVDTMTRSVSRRHSKADVALRGPAWGLSRWCWGRPVPEKLDVFGDLPAAESWRRAELA